MPGEGHRPDIESEAHKQRIAFIDATSGVDDRARDIAEARLIEEQDTLRHEGGFRNFFKRIWKSKMQEYYRVKEVQKAKQEIQSENSFYVDESGSQMAHREAMGAVVERFVSEFEEDMVHQGEERKMLEGEQKLEVEGQVKDLIQKYATGEMDDDMLSAERVRLFSKVTGVTEEQFKNQVGYADNLITVAKEARRAVEHCKALEDLDLEFDFVVGKARMGARTEVQLHTVDKIIDGIKSSKFGRFFDETGLALAVAAVYSTAAAVLPSVARSRAAAWATFGASALIGGGFAAARENKRLKEERALHGRQRATGVKFDEKSKRRAELEQFRHSTESAGNLLHSVEETQLLELWETKDYSGITSEQLQDFVAKISEIDARIEFSDRNKIDLISYSSVSSLETERQQLDDARAKGKAVIKAALASGKVTIDLGEHPNIDQYLATAKELRVNDFAESAEKNNRGFQILKAKKVAWTATKAVGIGLAIGGAVQEARAFIQPEEEGLIERAVQGHQKEHAATALESLRRWMTGETFSHHVGGEVKYPAGASGFPEGVDMVQSTDGTWTLQVDGNDVIKKLVLNPDGTIAEKSKQILENNGFFVRDLPSVFIEGQPITTETGAKQYIEQHPELFDEVKRKLWYDNNTPAPKFDKNELKLWWGGDKNAGLTEAGDFVMDVSHMFPKGSFHGAESTNAIEQFKTGNLKLLLSLSKDTQDQVVEIQIDSNGQAIIPKDSEIAKLFFDIEKGKAVFKGQYAEVAQMMGEKDNVDQVRLLATHVGKGVDGLPGEGPSPSTELHRWALDRVVKSSEDISEDWVLYPPPVIPYSTRKELEGDMPEVYGLSGGGKLSPEMEKIFREHRSKYLVENPEIKLDEKAVIAEYFERQDKKYVEHLSFLAESMGPISDECRVAICIPVAAHQEGKQIYDSLKNLSLQTADKKSYEVVLFVNYPEKDKEGNAVVPDETQSEIDRFKADFPEMPIKVMKEVLPLKDAKIGHIRKVLNDVVLLRQGQRGANSPELIMISNDADNKGVAPKYIETFIEKFDQNPEADGYLGQLDWDPESYVKFPAIHIGTRLFQALNMIGRRKSGRMSSSGANFAFRASIYAGVGGYIDGQDGAEDTNLGRAIILARGGNQYRIKATKTSDTRLYTSSRRAIDVFQKYGWAPVEQWDREFSAFDDEIRKLQLPDGTIDYSDPKVAKVVKRQIEHVINRTLDSYERDERIGKDGAFYKKALTLLGIKYKLDSKGNVSITNFDELLGGLKNYQTMGLEMQAQKSGKASRLKTSPKVNSKAAAEEILSEEDEQVSQPAEVIVDNNIQNIAEQTAEKKEIDIGSDEFEPLPDGVRAERWTELMGNKGILQSLVDKGLLTANEGKTIRQQLRKKNYDLVFKFLKNKKAQQSTTANTSRFKHLIDQVGRLGFTAHDAKRRIISSSERKTREGKRVQI
jgi:hypothetical protein